MIKTKLFILVLTLFLLAPKTFFGQGGGPVTLDGKQFKINGANFYPMVMNYAVELTMPYNSGANGWPNSYVTPYVEYGVNNGPIPPLGALEYIFECTNNNQCETDILTDWTYLSTPPLKFNTIRVAGFYPKYQHNGGNPNFFFSIRETGSYNWEYLPINLFVPNDPGLNFVLDQYEKLMELADQTGMKLIFNMIGQKSIFAQMPGPNNDEIDYYDKFLEHLATRVAGSPYAHTVLAYDLWNEPCYFDESFSKTKENTCEIISQWYTTVKAHGSTPLVTIGTCGSGDSWFYDPAVLKVDFHSLHIYPDWRDFEDRTHPVIQQRAISRIFDELYWFNKISPVPWIIGEIGFAASVNLPVSPPLTNQNGAHGNLTDQANFAQLVLDATCNSGGSGFSWWYFQDGWYFDKSLHEAHWGMLERGYATGDPIAEKPIVTTFKNYTLPSPVSSCGPSPVNTTSLQTYNPSLTYFNPYQHPANPSKTIKGYLMDQDANPIANAFVGGHMFVGIDPILNNEVDPFYRLFTAANGYFELIPYDYLTPNTLLPFEGDLHSLFLTSAGGERLKYSAKWLSNACSSIMPTPINSHSWLINRTNYAYNGEFINIYVVNGENRNIESNNQLTIESSIFYSGAISDIRAKREVHIKSGVHAQLGSSIHIYCEETSINCTNYNGYTMEYKLPGNPLSNNVESKPILELQFNKLENTSSFFVTPNPTNSFFQLHSESNEAVEINMLNMLGEFVISVRFKNTSEPISVTHLAKGVYLLKELNTGEVKKLILQ
ncbi:MAG: T9SS type A sorting domain-containing protein [Bacteroidia bacterium]|nr:T9SS type A sorting domain-containing protein [Bacteroidia bacterium]MBP7244947.1 T9SS type A sorting domain-containing protein [Bacteroidia bacterium]